MENRAVPTAIADGVAGIDLDADLVAEGVGVLHIRSVYDIDGAATPAIAQLADPAQTSAADRPARFLRLVKAVSMADDEVVDIDGTAFGRSDNQLMREIMGYAPIEPDGSVKLKVPANVAFYVSIVDAEGRRVGSRHQNWLQLRPGEERECAGCHDAESDVAHGRADAQRPSAHAGAPIDGQPYPNTDSLLVAEAGETMAEVNTRLNGVPAPSVDLLYADIWTAAEVRDKDTGISLSYSDLQSSPPTPANCSQQWSAACRITINYETHIHPLWGRDRSTLAADGVTVVADSTCTSCHGDQDAAGVLQVPLAQLDLADGVSPDQANHFNSYRELLFADNEQEVANGALLDVQVPVLDANGAQVFETNEAGELILDAAGQPIPLFEAVRVAPAMSVNGAAASERFFSPFASGASHDGYLNDAELRLVSEWLDIGGQYYNNPFAVPP